jgi:hypothetical protein
MVCDFPPATRYVSSNMEIVRTMERIP